MSRVFLAAGAPTSGACPVTPARNGFRHTLVARFRKAAIIRLVWLTLLTSAPVAAQTLTDGAARIAPAGDREVIVLSPLTASQADAPLAQAVAPLEVAEFTAQSHETATLRIHVVSYQGETFRAATPLAGSGSRIVFDPVRRTFVPLLQSIRVELGGGAPVDAIATEVGATGVTVFESLGFAIMELPEELHPADAVARVSSAYGGGVATVRLRRPRIEWR